jgi:hypothetical protein
MQLKLIDYGYILFSCLAGVWQGWCFGYSGSALLVIPMSLPFAVASYVHARLSSNTGDIARRPDWRRMLILWTGMPLSLVFSALIILAETEIMSITGFGVVNLPFANLRLLIGEGAASLGWATCLLLWSHKQGSRLPRTRLLALFVILFAGVLAAHVLSKVMLLFFQKDIHFVLTSAIVTTLSALILVFLRSKSIEVGGSVLASEA